MYILHFLSNFAHKSRENKTIIIELVLEKTKKDNNNNNRNMSKIRQLKLYCGAMVALLAFVASFVCVQSSYGQILPNSGTYNTSLTSMDPVVHFLVKKNTGYKIRLQVSSDRSDGCDQLIADEIFVRIGTINGITSTSLQRLDKLNKDKENQWFNFAQKGAKPLPAYLAGKTGQVWASSVSDEIVSLYIFIPHDILKWLRINYGSLYVWCQHGQGNELSQPRQADDLISIKVDDYQDYDYSTAFSWVTDPVLDTNAPTDSIGRQNLQLQYNYGTNNSLKEVVYADSKDGKNKVAAELNGSMTAQVTIPFTTDSLWATPVSYITFTYGGKEYKYDFPSDSEIAVESSNQAFNRDYYGFNLKTQVIPNPCKPFVSIDKVSIDKDFQVDKEYGTNNSSYNISWRVKDDPSEDVISSDQFIVYRSHDADFSDATAVNTIPLTSTSSELTKSKNDGYNWYSVTDAEEDAQYNSSKYGDKVYYKVARAFVSTQWPDCDSKYIVKDSLETANCLPWINTLQVSKKDANFEENKTAQVKVVLDAKRTIKKQYFRFTYNNSKDNNSTYYLDETNVGRLLGTKDNSHQPDLEVENIKGEEGCFYLKMKGQYIRLVDDAYDNKGYKENVYLAIGYKSSYGKAVFKLDNLGFLKVVKDNDYDVVVDKNGYIVINSITIDPTVGYLKKSATITDYNDPVRDAGMKLRIDRFSPESEWYEGKDLAAKTFYVSADDINYNAKDSTYTAVAEDVQSYPYTHYYYKVSVDGTNSNYKLSPLRNDSTSTEKEANGCYSESIAEIQKLEATRGTAKGRVVVSWNVGNGENSGYSLWKRECTNGNNENEWQKIELADSTALSYTDKDVEPGKAYEYKVRGCLIYRGVPYFTQEKQAAGYTCYYGRITGKMLMPDGSAVPLKTKVDVNIVKELTIPTIENKDSIVMPGVTQTTDVITVYTQEDGTFEVDSLPFVNGTKYNVSVRFDGITNPSGNTGEYTVTFTNDRYEYLDLQFKATNVRVLWGSVLYANSTIPSRNVQFRIVDSDGKSLGTIYRSNGEPVVTDNNGDYKFSVPANVAGVQAFKPGHKLQDDGMLTQEALVDGKKCDIADSTTVRLVGRLAGGNIQGDKQLGFGLSTNNLGDNLRIVMMLDGDNTSKITYDSQDPNKTERTQSFKQKVVDGNNNVKEYTDPTFVTFERKRIVVTPDSVTGEFCLDLPPVKYKITELSATGYSTLFNDGEGAAVLDLSADSVQITDTLAAENLYTSYNSVYNRVYHAPVNVTYKQCVNGIEIDYYGTQNLSATNVLGRTAKTKAYENGKYLFGYPVFQRGTAYDLHVTAHEDYYYNGVKNSIPDMVPLQNGKLHIDNGFMAKNNTKTFDLDSLGSVEFVLAPDNTSFSLGEEDALRQLNMQVEQNGYYYSADPLKGYVTGERNSRNGTYGTDIVPIIKATTDVESPSIAVMDIIRDPYTPGGYAWRDRGTKYSWNHTKTVNVSVNLNVSVGGGNKSAVNYGVFVGTLAAGTYQGVSSGASTFLSASTTIPGISYTYSHVANYDLTLNERLATSSKSEDIGAMADVYVGVIPTYTVYHAEAFNVVDDSTYIQLKPSIESGRVKLVTQGENSNGEKYYLIIADQMTLKEGSARTFAYSQKHIINNVIPELVNKLNEVVVDSTYNYVKNLANNNNKTYYRLLKKDFNIWTDTDWYEEVLPNGKEQSVDEVQNVVASIRAWINVIADNEARKLQAINSGTLLNKYSVSDANVDYTQSASYYEKAPSVFDYKSLKVAGVNLSQGIWEGMSLSSSLNPHSGSYMNDALGKGNVTETKTISGANNNTEVQVTTPVSTFKYTLTPVLNAGYSSTQTSTKVNTAGSGFHMGETDGCYLDVDVYKEPVDTEVSGNNENWVWNEENWEWMTNDGSANYELGQNHDYVFVVKGGAERNPWNAPDSTIAINPSMPLGTQTLKIDNPKLYITNSIVSNLPKDERAVFSIRMTNETEYKGNVSGLKSLSLKLTVDNSTNPNGAQLYIDGQSLTSGIEFKVAPGSSLVKTLEVARGTNAYDYENITLVLSDAGGTLKDRKSISVHYLPTSTAVKITSPTDKWIMNTFSPHDDDGKYYLPFVVSGFDINSDNFDHIECQYKKQTEGDDAWVNICSYYAKDDEYYQKATGTKKLLTSGTISDLRFYGEKDPVEMKYDLRAVSFTRLGSSYVTTASSVVSGTKDTRCPSVFGLPKPTNSVLTYSDVISVPFNEPIAYNYLDEHSDFQVMGYLNDSKNSYSTSLGFDLPDIMKGDSIAKNSEAVADTLLARMKNTGSSPSSKIVRNLTGSDFTIDMMVRLADKNQTSILAAMTDTTEFMKDAEHMGMQYQYANGVFRLYVNGWTFVSESILDDINPTRDLTHVGVSVSNLETNPEVKFYAGTMTYKTAHIWSSDSKYVDQDTKASMDFASPEMKKQVSVTGSVDGVIRLGIVLDGEMADVKLWSKALTAAEFGAKASARLSKNEAGLLAYWPMDEGNGTTLYDKINGCDLHFTSQHWTMEKGQHSLCLANKSVAMTTDGAYKFNSKAGCDYTLSFWMMAQSVVNAADTTSVISIGRSGDAKYFNVGINNNALMLTSGYNSYKISGINDIVDSEWHNVVIVSNHSHNTASFYVDGSLTTTLTADSLADIEGDTGSFGDERFKGYLDNITFWNLAYPSDCINQIYRMTPTGREMGLKIFMPFEHDELDDHNEYADVFNMDNEVYNIPEEGTDDYDTGSLTPDHTKMLDVESTSDIDGKDDYCPTSSTAGLQSLPFSWSSTDNELQINIQEPDWKINHQYVSVTVRNVEDLQGNVLQSPQMMMLYVNKNMLTWQNTSYKVDVEYGKGADINLDWQNQSGKTLSYTVDENYSWLTLSESMGTADPLSTGTITAHVDDGMAPGNYEAIVYITDENQLSSAVNLNVNIKGDAPDWEVTTDSTYCYTMNLRGQVMITENGVTTLDSDKDDIVYAFYDKVCVGKANIKVDNAAGTSYIYMTIKGNADMLPVGQNLKQINFMLWRASTNKTSYIKPEDAANTIYFHNNGSYGCPTAANPKAQPIVFVLTNETQQRISLKQGWNWLSFYVNPKDVTGVNYLFVTETPFTDGDMIVYTNNLGQRIASTWKTDVKGNSWGQGADGIDNNTSNHVYQLYVHKAGTAIVHGYEFTDETRNVTLTLGQNGKWNELAYLLDVDQPINTAMSDYSKYSGTKANPGTLIKSIDAFAVMNSDGKWEGSLEYMKPGQGYFIRAYGNDGEKITVKYTNTEVSGSAKETVFEADEDLDLTLTEGAKHVNSMPVIATTTDDLQQGDQIVAYANGELVGLAEETELEDGSKRFFITLNAEEGANVRFAHVRDGEVLAKSAKGLSFDGDEVAGTLDVPYVIDFSASTDDGDVFDISGLKYGSKSDINNRKGVFIIGDKKIAK